MLVDYKLGQGSIILRVKLRNSSVTTGAGLTGLTNSSSGLIISTIADNEASATVYTQAGSTIETITTLGTYAAPTATKCRFKEVDATNHKGVYELHIADARFAVANAKSLAISISGATNLAECDLLIPLRSVDPYDGVRAGLSSLPNASPAATGGLPTCDSSAAVKANVIEVNGYAAPSTDGSGRLDVKIANCTTGVFLTSHYNNDAVAGLSGTWLYSSASTSPTTGPVRWVQYYGTPTYNGKVVLIGYAGNVYMWWDSTNSLWTISTTIGTRGSAYFTATDPLGTWTAGGTATGAPSFVGAGFPIDNYFSRLKVNSSGNVCSDLQTVLTNVVTVDANNYLNVNAKDLGGTSQTGRDIGANVLLSSGTGTGQISLSSGLVTVGTNNDKTGYSLTQSFPSNFASLAITVGGAVTAGTVSDKSGYSLTQGFPSNFSSMLITAGGHIQYADTITTYTGNTVQTGDSYSRIGAAGAGLTSVGDTAGTTTLLGRFTSARAGYLDNLNVGGNVASHADILAINQSASKHLLLSTVGQYAPSEAYTIECRTFAAADGSAVNADSSPTLTVTGATSGSLSANLGAITNPSTGVYRWTYTVPSSPTLEQIRVDVSATISSSTFTLSAYTQTVDSATAIFTSTDKSNLTAIFNKLPTNNIADETLLISAIGTPLQASSYTTPPTAAAIRTEMDANSTKLANLDATVSSRLAPSGTLATVTILTNAPTSGDFTTAMKTSLNAATPASVIGAVGSVTANVNTNANSTEIAIKAKTDNIGTNSMDSSNSATANSSIATIAGKLPTNNIADETLVLAAINALPMSAPTAVQIRQEMDSNSTKLASAATAMNVSSAQTAIIGAIDGLGSNVTVTSPLSSDGTKLHITQGDSYTSTMGNSISFNITNQTGLIGAIPHLRFDGSSTDFAVAPVITSGTQAVTFNDVTTATTQALTPGTNIRYQIRFVNGSNKYTPIGGVAIIAKGL